MSSGAVSVAEHLAGAREKLEGACELLLSPTAKALDRCAPLLEAAVEQMAACQKSLTGSAQAESDGKESRRVRLAVRRAKCLLQHAAEYHHNWMKRVGAMSAGYDSHGEPAAVVPGCRLLLKG